MTTLSTHVLDLERGIPARGVNVSLYQHDRLLAQAATDLNGRIPGLGGALEAGEYAIVFDVAAYLAVQGRGAPFLQRVRLEFSLDPAQPHYHIPLLMTPYACSSYRGS